MKAARGPLTPATSFFGDAGSHTASGAGLLPSFFVVGPPRTGTSWLHEILSQHTHLPSPSKETRFFDTHFDRGLKWYHAHFKHANGNRKIGEVAPTYFASSKVRERLTQVIPGAKIVCIFRDPVERIVSLYRLKRAYGMIPWSFEKAILHDPELMESSRYAFNLKAWQRLFGEDKVLPTIYDDLRDRPQAFVDSLADFIDIPRFTLAPAHLRRVHDTESMTQPRNYYRTRSATAMADWLKARRLDKIVAMVKDSPLRRLVLGGGPRFGELSADTLNKLYEHFQPEVEELEIMLDRSLSWKMLTAA